MWTLLVSVVSAVLFVAVALPVFSQGTPAPGYERNMPPPGAYEARLDALAAANDFGALGKAVVTDIKDMETASRALNWLRAQQFAKGGSSYIAYLYAALLWRTAQSVPEPGRAGLSQNAGIQLMQARWLIQAEGFQCADTTALQARWISIESGLLPLVQYVAKLPEADKKKINDIALEALLVTFPARQNDVWLCQGGMAQYGKYFEKHPEVGKKSIDELKGKTIVLDDPSILPDFVLMRIGRSNGAPPSTRSPMGWGLPV
jgi:hypothetical protein